MRRRQDNRGWDLKSPALGTKSSASHQNADPHLEHEPIRATGTEPNDLSVGRPGFAASSWGVGETTSRRLRRAPCFAGINLGRAIGRA
jgi:hypothetical protein